MKTRIILVIMLGMFFSGCGSGQIITPNLFTLSPESVVVLPLKQTVEMNGHELTYEGFNWTKKYFMIRDEQGLKMFSINVKEAPTWGKLIRFLEATPQLVKFSYQNLAKGNPPEAVKF